MGPRDRILGPIASVDPTDRERVTVGFDDLLSRLVLCEEFVLESQGLREFPLLVRKFGYDGVKELLGCGRLQIQAEALTIGSVGQVGRITKIRGDPMLPLGSYAFSAVKLADDHKHYIHECLQPMNEIPSLRGRQAQKLRKAVAQRVRVPPADSGEPTVAQMTADLEANHPSAKASIAIATSKHVGKPVGPADFELAIESLGPEGFRTETDLGTRLNLDERETHQIVERGLLGVGGLNQRVELMQRFDALTGFQADQLPLFEAKLSFITRQLDPDATEERFGRIREIAGLPTVDPDPDVHDVDLPRLLEVTQSDEAREFRQWLRDTDSMSDAEIEAQISRLQDSVRSAVHSPAGKVVRFVTTQALGLTAGDLSGIGGGALDEFVLERLLPPPGPTAFVSRLYPSVFRSD